MFVVGAVFFFGAVFGGDADGFGGFGGGCGGGDDFAPLLVEKSESQ